MLGLILALKNSDNGRHEILLKFDMENTMDIFVGIQWMGVKADYKSLGF